MNDTKCCAYAFGGVATPATSSPGGNRELAAIVASVADPDSRRLLSALFSYQNFWLRSPDTWLALGEHLRGLDRPVTIWVGGCWTGREGFSAGIACAYAGVKDWRVEVVDKNAVYIGEMAGPRGGRFKTEEIAWDVPPWGQRFFRADGSGHSWLHEEIRGRVSFAVGDFTRDEPPRCDVAIVSDVWRRPSASWRREQEEFPHRDLPVLSLRERRALAARIHHRLAPDGLLMVAPRDIMDIDGMSTPDVVSGRVSGASCYDPPPPIAELFQPLDPDGQLFQLLWCRK